MARRSEFEIEIKRVYEPASPADGDRILVDRIWPRGLSKDAVAADLWMNEIAPSTELRKWFGHEPARWPEFQARYRKELEDEAQAELLGTLVERVKRGKVTLVFGAKDEERNQAVVLLGVVRERLGG